MGADRSLGRQLERVVGRLDQQNPGSAVAFQPPGGAARDQDVITVAEYEVAVVAEQMTGARMHEQNVVAVGVAGELGHPAFGAPEADLCRRVSEDPRRRPRRALRPVDLVEIERARAERSLEPGPCGRRVPMVQLGRRPEETLAADLALSGALRQIAVRLTRSLTLDARKRNPIPHLRYLPFVVRAEGPDTASSLPEINAAQPGRILRQPNSVVTVSTERSTNSSIPAVRNRFVQASRTL